MRVERGGREKVCGGRETPTKQSKVQHYSADAFPLASDCVCRDQYLHCRLQMKRPLSLKMKDAGVYKGAW